MTVAMAVLVILMLLLFQFLAGSQRAWRLSQRNTRIYENARVALELVQREMKMAVASSESGQEIPFYAGDPCVFVAATDLSSSSAVSRLAEVTYYLDGNSLYRRAIEFGESDCDFYGQTAADDTWAGVSPVPASTDGEQVIRGVEEFEIDCFNYDAGNNPVLIPAGTINQLPDFVQVSVTLFDEKLLDMPAEVLSANKDQTLRTFTKIIFLKSD